MAEIPIVNVVFLGDEDSGKSTVIGHLLQADIGTLEAHEKNAAETGVPAHKFTWRTTHLPQESHTVNVSAHLLATETVSFTLFDVPGRGKWAGNLIAGTSCADAAVMVVSAERGEFEWATGRFGQVKEQLIVAFTMGVKQLIVAINKIDTCNARWAGDRYEEITNEISSFIRKVGYNSSKVSLIPISGWHGWNLTEHYPAFSWYSGPTLLQALLSLSIPKRPVDKPLRLSILQAYRIPGIGTVAVGRVQSGSFISGSNIAIAPYDMSTRSPSIERHHMALEKANAGEFVGFNVRNISSRDLKRGFVVGTEQEKAHECVSFAAQVIVLFHPGEVRPGYRAILHCHTAKVACKLTVLQAKIDRRTGRILENTPASVKTGDAFQCDLQPERPICVEPFPENPSLGRFILRDMGVVVAVGVIKEVERRQPKSPHQKH